MSSIDKLGIRGIRSFGPDTEEVIQFYKPLTVIVGPNGCGKTTIIECLKYVTTGLLPPSAKNGQNFVHDPKLAGTTKVSAQIKLTLRTNARERMYLGRSMELHQKRTKMEFKATDGVVKIRKADGTESTQTHRCSDLDRSVPEFMGVSRPILESVIFCHQEDSNWPLQEAAVLKKKFDDIFESTRYTKALDVIRKQRKSLVDAYKDAQRDLDVLQHTLGIAQGKRDEMERLEGERERLVDAQREAEERREEVQNQLREYDAVMNDLLDLERDIEQAELLFREREAVFRRSTAELDGYDTAGDKAALQEAVFKVDGQMAEKRARRIQVSEQEASAQRKVDKLIAEAQGVAVSQATLQEKHRVHDSAKRRMQRTARELQKRYALPQSAVQCQTTHEAMGILRRIKQAREEAEATLDQHERGTRERSDKLSDAVNAARAAESDLDIRMAHVEQQRQECASRVAEIKREMQSAGRGGSNAQQFADRVKNEIKRLSEQEQDAPRRELAELQRQEGERQKRVEELSAELMTAEPLLHSLEANQEEIARVSARRMDIQARRERLLGDVQSRAHKVTEAFDAVNALGDGAGETVALSPQVQDLIEGSTDVDVVGLAPGLLGSLQDGERKLKAHSHDLESQLKRKDQELFLLSTKVREAKQKMEFLMKEVETCDSKLPKAIRDKVNELSEAAEEAGAGGEHESEGERLERVVVAPLRKRVADKEDRFKLIANKKTLARVNMKRVKKTGKCPTCDQSVEPCEFVLDSNITWFGDVLEASVYTGVDALVVKLAESVSGDKYVEEVTRREEELRSDQRQLEQMMPYIPVLVRLNELEKQQTQTMDLWQDLTNKKEALESERIALSDESESRLSAVAKIKDVVDDAVSWARIAQEIKDGEQAITFEEMSLQAGRGGGGGGVGAAAGTNSLEDVRKQVSALVSERDGLRQQSEKGRARVDVLREQQQQHMERVQKLQAQELELRAQVSRAESLEKECQELSEKDAALREQLRAYRDAKKDRASDSLAAGRARTKADGEDRAKRQTLVRVANEAKQDEDEVAQLTAVLEKGDSEDVAGRLSELESQMNDVLRQRDEAVARVEALRAENADLSSTIALSQSIKDKMNRYLQLKETEEELLEMKNDIANKRQEFQRAAGTEQSLNKKQVRQLRTESTTLAMQHERTEGKLSVLNQAIAEVGEVLQQQKYANVASEHRSKMIQTHTTKLAAADMDKYHKALDSALMQYHTTKVGEINKRIRELWRSTYRGGDIDRIDLRAERSETARSRSYSYRVAMTKGDTDLDMRGRCSAGQKVLASLIIRLALAETFSVNCGILALDEPTTNLDHENKISFAAALGEIIKQRRGQANFQLIVITHDEEFVEMLSHADVQVQGNMGYYFRVSRQEVNGKYLSRIDQQEWGS